MFAHAQNGPCSLFEIRNFLVVPGITFVHIMVKQGLLGSQKFVYYNNMSMCIPLDVLKFQLLTNEDIERALSSGNDSSLNGDSHEDVCENDVEVCLILNNI